MGLGRFQSQARNQGSSDFVTRTVRTVYGPLVYGFSETSESVGEFFDGIFRANELVRENNRLRSLELAASLYDEQAKRYQDEIKRLRAMIDLPDVPGKTRVPASVTGYFPNESRATIDIGRDQGVRTGMPVVTAEGLYGKIQTVDADSSQVLLISSPQLKIMGKVLRDPPPLGFIQGQSTGTMVFDVVDAKSLPQTGDRVYTSGLSNRIPAGILIGEIVQSGEDVAYGSKRCQVFPSVQVGGVREVFVLK